MATRGAIVRLSETGFLGVRHERYSMPEALGKQLWDLYHGHFEKDLGAMLRVLLDDHQAGWSTIVGADFTLPPGYVISPQSFGPICYCHGRLSAAPFPVTPKTIFERNIAWTYAFDESKRVLWVIYNDLDTKQLAESHVVEVALDGKEPDWKLIRCGPKFERCEHLAVEHYPELANKPAGRMRAAAYAGTAPLTMQDACAVMYGGYRYELTGRSKGGNGVFHAFCTIKGSTDEKDITMGKEMDGYPGGYIPGEHATWIFPPRLGEVEETMLDRTHFMALHGAKKAKIIAPPEEVLRGLRPAAKKAAAAPVVPAPVIRLGERELVVAD